ncbi:MAG: HzsA-related protein [Planctomycetota bacterium]
MGVLRMPAKRLWLCMPALLVAAPHALAAQTNGFADWTPRGGRWVVRGDVYAQTDGASDRRSFAPAAEWRDYVYEVSARKTGGNEGFLILFRVKDHGHFYWWNIGGWGNSRHALETRPSGGRFRSKPGRIETGRWYRIKVVVEGPSIKCYLDDELLHDEKNDLYPSGGVGLGTWSTKVEYKDVRVTDLEGRKLYGVDAIDASRAALAGLDGAGEPFRKEFRSLLDAGADANDPRWRELAQRVGRSAERVRAGREALKRIDLGALRAAVERSVAASPSGRAKGEALLERLAEHERLLAAMRDGLSRGAQVDVGAIEKAVAFAAEAKRFCARGCPPVAFVKRRNHGMSGTNGTMHARVHGVGRELMVYDPAVPEDGAKTIFRSPEGFIFDMNPSYDAKKLVMSYRTGRREPFHVYEIGVDGSGMRQLTDGPYHDVSPAYLPDGRIVFNTTRVESYSLCQNFLAAALYVMQGDGTDIRRLEYSSLCDMTPFVLQDGSILYSRWEYQDKNIFCVQALWTVNPNGTRVQLFYGNTLTIPNSMYGAKEIPGTDRVVFTMAAHHHPPIGAIAVLDRRLGIENPKAMRNITPEVPYRPTAGRNWRDKNWGPGDKLYRWSYVDPWPVEEDMILVSYGGPLDGSVGRYRLFLMDESGNKVPLYEDPEQSCFMPVPLRPRALPHLFPGNVPETPQGNGRFSVPAVDQGEGRFFVLDVYRGLEEKGVTRGQVKQLRVMCQLPKKYNTEGPRYADHYPAIGEGTYYVKYNYGTVPVREDGSAYFVAPAGVELYFQVLDTDGKEVRRMGSVTQLVPGEVQGCIGCHEPRFSAPPRDATTRMLRGEPDRITPPQWGAGPVDFVKQVQPVLDRHCVECHRGPKAKGRVDLSGDKTRFFNMAFETLVFGRDLVARYHINPGRTGNFPPLATGSYVSRLTELIEKKHEKADVDDEGRRRIYTWIDANVPYYSTWDMTRPHSKGGRDTWYDRRGKPLPWFQAFMAAWKTAGLPGDPKSIRNADINLTKPEWSRVLLVNLAKSAGGWADDAKAASRTTDAPGYRAVLSALEQGRDALLAKPRVDMPGAVPVPQKREFGRVF